MLPSYYNWKTLVISSPFIWYHLQKENHSRMDWIGKSVFYYAVWPFTIGAAFVRAHHDYSEEKKQIEDKEFRWELRKD